MVLLFTLLNTLPICSQAATPRYRIAACDWMMLKRQKLGEFKLAHELGADGVEVDMGGLGKRVLFDNQLREPQQAEKFQAAARQYGVAVPSMAMSGFFAQSFLTRDNYQDLLKDCFQTMKLFAPEPSRPIGTCPSLTISADGSILSFGTYACIGRIGASPWGELKMTWTGSHLIPVS